MKSFPEIVTSKKWTQQKFEPVPTRARRAERIMLIAACCYAISQVGLNSWIVVAPLAYFATREILGLFSVEL